jgi:hypothetical protein
VYLEIDLSNFAVKLFGLADLPNENQLELLADVLSKENTTQRGGMKSNILRGTAPRKPIRGK